MREYKKQRAKRGSLTDEMRIEYNKNYYRKNRDKFLKYQKEYYQRLKKTSAKRKCSKPVHKIRLEKEGLNKGDLLREANPKRFVKMVNEIIRGEIYYAG